MEFIQSDGLGSSKALNGLADFSRRYEQRVKSVRQQFRRSEDVQD
jgi:hypothetical protein